VVDGKISIWDFRGVGAPVCSHHWQAHVGRVDEHLLMNDGLLASSSYNDNDVRVWHIKATTPCCVYAQSEANIKKYFAAECRKIKLY
jgi:WD40 repeat protein